MRQQVNLLAPMFRKHRTLVSARISATACALVMAALGLVYAHTAWQAAALAAEEARLVVERETTTRRLHELAAQLKGGGRDPALEARAAALSEERDRKQHALATLSRGELGDTRGFSPHLAGLARQRLDGLWLTRIEVAASGRQVALEGVTLSEQLIPRYLEKLGAEPVFAGTAFADARLERRADGPDQLAFVLSARNAGAGAAR